MSNNNIDVKTYHKNKILINKFNTLISSLKEKGCSKLKNYNKPEDILEIDNLYSSNSDLSCYSSDSSSSSTSEISYHYPINLDAQEKYIFNYTNNNQNTNQNNNQTQLKIIEKIGSGAFCRVYKVLNIETNKLYALKIFKSGKNYLEYYENEVKIHNIISKHINYKKHIVILNEHFTVTSEYGTHGCILYELCGEDLGKLLNKCDDNSLPLPMVKKIIQEVLKALSILHENNIIHTDLKPENILLVNNINNIEDFDDFHIKLIDMGSSMLENEIDTHSIGTDPYLAPEVVLRGDYDKSVDIWALGNVIFELTTGSLLIDPEDYYQYSETSSYSSYNSDESDNNSTNSSNTNSSNNSNTNSSNNSTNSVSNNSNDYSDDDDEDCGNYEYIHTHISLFHKIFGPIPKDLIENSEYYDLFYTKNGKLNNIPRYIHRTSIKDILENNYEFNNKNDASEINSILEFIFKYDPKDRPTINNILKHNFFKGNLKKQYLNILRNQNLN